MKKFIKSILAFTFVVTSLGFVPVVAEEQVAEPYIVEIDNVVYEFPDVETYERHMSASMSRSSGQSGKSTLIFSNPTGKMLIGVHPFTNYWTYADSYYISVSKTKTYSLSKGYKGYTFSGSVTNQAGVGITVKANNSKQSKLAVYGYGDYRRTKWDIYNYDIYQYSYYTNVIRMRPDSQSIEVMYR